MFRNRLNNPTQWNFGSRTPFSTNQKILDQKTRPNLSLFTKSFLGYDPATVIRSYHYLLNNDIGASRSISFAKVPSFKPLPKSIIQQNCGEQSATLYEQ